MWEGKPCGLGQNDGAYRNYTPATGTVAKDQDVKLLEYPPSFYLPRKSLDFLDGTESSYERGVIDFMSFLDPILFDVKVGANPAQLACLRPFIRHQT